MTICVFHCFFADKFEGSTSSTEKPTDGDKKEPVVWPFIMALIALMVAALVFGSLIGWFYRKEVIQFARDTVGKPGWKVGGSGGVLSHNNGLPTSMNRPPIPPPRSKNKSSMDLHNGLPPRRQLTPDVISQPMQVTINGLAV